MAFSFQVQNGDWVFSDRKFVKLTGQQKVLQSFDKAFMTEKEYSKNKTTYTRYNPNYGSTLNQTEKYLNLSREDILSIIQDQVSESIKNFITQQEGRSNLTAEEIIENVDFMVYSDADERTKVRFDIVATLANTQTTVSLGSYSQTIA